MIKDVLLAIIGSYAIGWLILKFAHYLDHRSAEKYRAKLSPNAQQQLDIGRFEHRY